MAEKKGPRGAACRPKAVGWRAVATPRMTRRGFLGGGAAAPIALNSAFAANTDSDEARLEFDLSEDGSALNITESRNAQIVAQWHVEVASFGPHAWFELHAVSEPLGLRILKVRQAEFGGASQIELRFTFTPKLSAPTSASEPARYPVGWSLKLETALWGSGAYAAAAWVGGEVDFIDFAAPNDAKPLKGAAAARSVGDWLNAMFADRVDTDRKAAAPLSVAFDKTALWTLARESAFAAEGFDSRVGATRFTLGWHRDVKDLPFFLGYANPAEVRWKHEFVLGDRNGTHLVATPREAAALLREPWEVRRVNLGADKPVFLTYAKLPFPPLTIQVFNADGPLADALAAEALSLTETALPLGGGTLRHVAWEPVVKFAAPQFYEVTTFAGILSVGPPEAPQPSKDDANPSEAQPAPAAPKKTSKNPTPDPTPPNDQAEAALAVGDRGGAPDSPIFAVFDKPKGADEYSARRISFDLALLGSDFALPDASRTTLVFDKPPLAAPPPAKAPPTVTPPAAPPAGNSPPAAPPPPPPSPEYADLRLFYEDGLPLGGLPSGEFPQREASSFLWLGAAKPGGEVARFDLSRALLTASRDRDLAHLGFRFLDLSLSLRLGEGASIRPAREDCRVLETSPNEFRDNRPVLVVEFPPQHVFEEAIFGQTLQLPDVVLAAPYDRASLLAALEDPAADQPRRIEIRNNVQSMKKSAENGSSAGPFNQFCDAYQRAEGWSSLLKDQQIYIGPLALDPDSSAVARAALNTLSSTVLKGEIDAMFDRVRAFLVANNPRANGPVLMDSGAGTCAVNAAYLPNALRNETVLEQQEPLYGVFRDFYREVMLNSPPKGANTTDRSVTSPLPTSAALDVEFFAEDDRPPWLLDRGGPPPCKSRVLKQRETEVRKLFLNKLVAANPLQPQSLVEARLSGPSRLAFRLNCAPPPDADAVEAGIELSPRVSNDAPGNGGVRYDAIPFSLAGLTDWSRHEPSVTRRAQKLFTAAKDGLVPPIGFRAANLSDADNLTFQGLSLGAVTAEQRLGEIRAALARKPLSYETAIEIPSRLTLSTAQDAIWFTKRPPSWPMRSESGSPSAVPGEAPTPPCIRLHGKEALWVARLAIDEAEPGLRVVDSPDLRPNALTWLGDGGAASATLLPRQMGQGAPPRGSLAPWFIAPEQMDGGTLTPADAYTALENNHKVPDPQSPPRDATDDNLCAQPWHDRLYLFLRQLCDRRAARPGAAAALQFRTVLDAYDRHELVLLSSAYGLPVIGRRQQTVDASGQPTGRAPLAPDSGQFDPGEDFAVIDADDDQAMQRPQALRPTEMWLSGLGGTLLHDTRFQPSAGANSLYGGKIFDGFSVERWHEEVVLGRDIVGAVVYKGYLFPLGHRASLVKLTERLFVRSQEFGVKAVLVQRIFLRIGRKAMSYPALGQPLGGRLWCAKNVSIETTQTPDLQDPFAQPGACALGDPNCNPENLSGGRIWLNKAPGLAFWPRVNESESGLVKFAIVIDGAMAETPLVFVDNVAATSGPSLRALCDVYRVYAGWTSRRTMQLRDQKLRYAQELKTGDCTFKTRSLRMTVSGLAQASLGAGWAEGLDNYETNSALEGAEQPPFYPAVEYASVRLEQLERFSGRKAEPLDVQYDGRYARFGFKDALPKGADQAARNPLDVFLNLRTCALLTMGASGDHSGGVGRPENYVVAVGRRNGPLSVRNEQLVRLNDGPSPVPGVPDPTGQVSFTVHADGDQLIVPGAFDASNFPRLRSLADYFDTSLQGRSAAEGGTGGLVGQARELLKKYFSLKAKILGVISFIDLLELLGFSEVASLADATPVLKETLQFGAALSEAGDNLAQAIHSQLLKPLLDAVRSFQSQWDAAGARIGGVQTLKPGKAFPEIDVGLKDLFDKLAAALNDNDTLGLALDLAEVYESAQAFAAALERIAANPAARLQQTVIDAINDVLGQLAAPLGALAPGVKELSELIADVNAGVVQWAQTEVRGAIASVVDTFALSLPTPRLPDLAAATGESLDPQSDIAKAAGTFEDELKAAVAAAAADAVTKALTEADLTKVRAAFIQTLTNGTQSAVAQAIGAINNLAAPVLAAGLLWRDELETLHHDLALVDPAQTTGAPLVASIFKAADFAQQSLSDFKALIAKPASVVEIAADLAGYLFGFDNQAFVDGGQTLKQILDGAVVSLGAAELGRLLQDFAIPAQAPFADAVAVCDAFARLDESARRGDYPHRTIASGQIAPPPLDNGAALALEGALTALEAALAALKAADVAAQAWESAFGPDETVVRTTIIDSATTGGLSATQTQDALDALDNLAQRLRGAGADPGAIGHVADLYCDAIASAGRLTAVLNALIASVTPQSVAGVATQPTLSGAFVERLGAFAREATAMGQTLGRDLFLILQSVASIQANAVGLALDFFKTNLAVLSIPQSLLDPLATAAADLEIRTVQALVLVIDVAADLSNDAKAFGGKLSSAATSILKKFDDAMRNVGLGFPESVATHDAFASLDASLAQVPALSHLSPPSPPTFAMLTAAVIGANGAKVSEVFGGPAIYGSPIAAAHNAEAAAVAALGALAARVKGLPDVLAKKLVVKAAPLFLELAKDYGTRDGEGLLKLRAAISDNIKNIGLEAVARRDLYVADVYGLPNFPGVDVSNRTLSLDVLDAGDRLAEEAVVLAQAANFANLSGPDADRAFAHLTRYALSWSAHAQMRAAPREIADKVTELAREALKGEILSLIDISAVRTALLDALANLIPTKATFAYDFDSTVENEAGDDAIFQPQQGAEFSLSTRIVVDLLQGQNVNLTTKGSLGPFAIALVGSLVKALTLRFGGAKFEAQGGGAPRFDISYQAYEIGPALDFVKQLQVYLTPSDGAGFHVGPSELGAGIEAGYGVNLGAISIGPVSFFNIIFDVSADLPFDDRQALFKTSLGTRTTPFTISALPYAGSGFFSIYASADGIRGFEAGFLFGGGGALKFGPLTAQVQVQVGAFIRILKIKKGDKDLNLTEVAGTFLAAGSASIWIFHFGASLYVALSQTSPGGNMRGEATFTFSFSCGFLDYHYSVTAHHDQAPIGQNNDRSAWLEDGKPLTQLAFANPPGRMSDAYDDLLEIAATAGGARKPRPMPKPPSGPLPDVTSAAICQSEDWSQYASYFDVTLLKGH
jgi:hypothetical protein